VRIVGLIGLLALALTGAGAAPRIHVQQGWVEGVSDGAVTAYKGLPFAKPPLGDLRWRPPQAPEGWSGVRDGSTFGAPCMQPAPPRGTTATPSEDCLTLNVWAPQAKAGASLPVMVWIYGGGFRTGSGSMPIFDGAALAKKGVILVTFNYRLGKFGWMAHPELTRESGHGASGNYGLMDQIAALQWVQANIAGFGGDPKRVTVFGQSAGSHSLAYLIASPQAKGLFSRAIAESGSPFLPGKSTAFGHPLQTLAEAEKSGLRMQAYFHAASLADLREVPARELQAAPTVDGNDMSWGIVDGWILPDAVDAIFAAHRQNDVPVLLGFNSNEAATLPHVKTLAAFQAAAAKTFGAQASNFTQLYPAADDPGAERSSEESERDNHFGWQTWAWAHRQHDLGRSKVFYYFFDVHPPLIGAAAVPGDWGAHHEGEIAYVFGNLEQPGWAPTDRDRRVSDAIQNYWVNFAAKADPNGPRLPIWTPFDPARPQLMTLDEHPSLRPVPNQQRIAFWESLARQ